MHEVYDELIEKRREVIDLTADLDRAKREINELERAAEAWKEKVDYLEEQLAIRQAVNWYLRPLFCVALGTVLGIVACVWAVRWYL